MNRDQFLIDYVVSHPRASVAAVRRALRSKPSRERIKAARRAAGLAPRGVGGNRSALTITPLGEAYLRVREALGGKIEGTK